MKLFATIAAGFVALGTVAAPAAANAQRTVYAPAVQVRTGVVLRGAVAQDRRMLRHDRRVLRHDRRVRRHVRYVNRHRARSRVVCRVQRGHYGPVRRCYRVYR